MDKELKSKAEGVQHLFYKEGKVLKVFGRKVTWLVRSFEYSIQKQSEASQRACIQRPEKERKNAHFFMKASC